MKRNLSLLPVCLMAGVALAQTIESTYTSLDLEADCRWTADDGEVSMGGSAVCQGLRDYPVHVGEGDLRMFAAFGPAVGGRLHRSTSPNTMSMEPRIATSGPKRR